ncbi:MAG: hypothetical protein QOG91_358 [Candidatus Parcubacteria bacterium]|jgi:hypothetical protein|nr:hypothetical protein [Candidatus Parcubacteria bacterium]
MEFIIHFVLYAAYASVIALAIALAATHIVLLPSNDRDWSPDQAVLSSADIHGDLITIHNIRNFTYASTTNYTARYYDKTFDLKALRMVWYIVVPFVGIPGSAHTFLSFEFEGNQFLSISVEIRKQKGEMFSPVSGLFNQYEIMYVIADERDIVKLRTDYRKELVYMYPVRASAEKMQAVFLDMLKHANRLTAHPEFYNTITNTCTTNIVRHVNKISPKKIPWNWKILFPAKSDEFAYDLGMIDTDLTFAEARQKFFINDKAMKYADDADFSVKIRE